MGVNLVVDGISYEIKSFFFLISEIKLAFYWNAERVKSRFFGCKSIYILKSGELVFVRGIFFNVLTCSIYNLKLLAMQKGKGRMDINRLTLY